MASTGFRDHALTNQIAEFRSTALYIQVNEKSFDFKRGNIGDFSFTCINDRFQKREYRDGIKRKETRPG